jgi:hypothetical protein
MKLPKEKQQHLILVGLVTVVACAGLWFGLIERQKSSMATLNTKKLQTEAKVLSMKTLIRADDRIAADLEAAERKLSDIEATFADGDLYSWFILKLREFQASYPVDTPQIGRELRGEVKLLPRFPYEQATYSVRGTALYEDLGRFLADFENKFPYAWLANLELEPDYSPNATDLEKLTFKIDVSVLIKPNAPSAP